MDSTNIDLTGILKSKYIRTKIILEVSFLSNGTTDL